MKNTPNGKGKKVVIGMSGGVDSSVAAYLLKEAGYDVIGVTMQIWQQEYKQHCDCHIPEDSCCGIQAIEDASRVANQLDIPYYVMNFKDVFEQEVIRNFVQEYRQGRTPNPCIVCNRKVKWEALLRRSLELGADYIATGHYARVEKLANGRYAIRNSVTAKKDQTYALYNLTQEQLSHTLMPVGAYSKEEVREIAEKIGLEVAKKPDSQEICFIPDHDYAGFIEEYTGIKSVPGSFVDRQGFVLGRHRGIIHYTVGQRKGLGLSLKEPAFVLEIRPKSNEVVLGFGREIYSDTVYAENINYMSEADFEDGRQITAKIRYNHQGAPARIYHEESGKIRCVFEEEQRAITPGQALVLYDGEYVFGGGTICLQ